MATKRDFVIGYGLQADKSTGASNTLVVDYINDKVGVGLTNPSHKLTIDGDVGIGAVASISTNHMLDIASTKGTTNQSAIRALYPGGGQLTNTEFAALANRSGAWRALFVNQGSAAHGLYVTAANNYISGNLGLNGTAPNFLLDVNGDARITSTNRLRFGGTSTTSNYYIQYNSTNNSLDFVAG